MTSPPRIGAVIVNYNSSRLSVDAALSVLGAAPGRARAVIVDNASTDGSAEYFRALAGGEISHQTTSPGGPAPVAFAEPGAVNIGIAATPEECAAADIAILPAASNRGFAAGCNLGLTALSDDEFTVLLLLNPDALLSSYAVDAFAARLSDPDVGLVGGTVIGFDPPHLIQACGGARLDPVTLAGRNLGAGYYLHERPPAEEIESRLTYPLGAAIAFRPDYLARAGKLDDRYFLYFEEVDWAFAGGRFLRVGWAPDAVVYHRYGAATGSRRDPDGRAFVRSPVSEYHMARSRQLFALKWRPHAAPFLLPLAVAEAARRLARRRPALAGALFRGALPGAPRRFPG